MPCKSSSCLQDLLMKIELLSHRSEKKISHVLPLIYVVEQKISLVKKAAICFVIHSVPIRIGVDYFTKLYRALTFTHNSNNNVLHNCVYSHTAGVMICCTVFHWFTVTFYAPKDRCSLAGWLESANCINIKSNRIYAYGMNV